jgi:sulfonate transport system substrate-binding protein
VPEGSPIKSVRDLKGKKVAVTKGAGSHYLLLAALAKAGLSFGDISPAYLTAADGRAAFVSGNVDAWVAWDPYLTIATHQSRAHILADGSNGLASYKRYYLASAAYSEKHPDVLSVIYGKLHDTGLWVKKNPKEASVLLSKAWGIDARIIEESINHRSYRVAPVTISGLSEQQKIADAFTAEKLLPRKIDTADVTIWAPKLKEVSTGH